MHSVRINERPARRALPGTELSPSSIARMDVASKENKKLAYLLDLEHIRVVDLVTGINVATINHDAKVRSSRGLAHVTHGSSVPPPLLSHSLSSPPFPRSFARRSIFLPPSAHGSSSVVS
jgi:hypothetical protein